MSFVDKLYRGIFRRTSTFALACIAGAFVFERGFDLTAETIFQNMNRGKLWKDVKDKYCEEE